MCLIIDRPEATPIDDAIISRAMAMNSHGWGIMRAEDGVIHIVKGFGEKGFRKAYRKVGAAPCVIHYRMATHGNRNIENCHPFAFGDGRYALMHNGIIGTAPSHDKTMSDTWHFTEDVVAPILAHNPDLFGTPRLDNILAALAGEGNKLVILRRDGAKMRVNGQEGTEQDGLWLSNTWSIAPPRIATTTYQGRSTGTVWKGFRDEDYTVGRGGSYRLEDYDKDDAAYEDYLKSRYAPAATEAAETYTLEDLATLSRDAIEDYCVEDPAWIAGMIHDYLA